MHAESHSTCFHLQGPVILMHVQLSSMVDDDSDDSEMIRMNNNNE